jgi:hypothetical protein
VEVYGDDCYCRNRPEDEGSSQNAPHANHADPTMPRDRESYRSVLKVTRGRLLAPSREIRSRQAQEFFIRPNRIRHRSTPF